MDLIFTRLHTYYFINIKQFDTNIIVKNFQNMHNTLIRVIGSMSYNMWNRLKLITPHKHTQ